MKPSLKIALVLTLASFHILAVEIPYKLGDLKTMNGEEFHDVIVTQKTAAGIAVTHDSGLRSFTWDKLPVETQRLLGYDAAAEDAARKKNEADFAAALKKLREAAARLSPQQLKKVLATFSVSPGNAQAWRLTFSDVSTATIAFSYTAPAQWFPLGGIALTR